MKFLRRIIAVILAFAVMIGLAVAWFFHTPSSYDARLSSFEKQAEKGVERGRWPGVMWAVVAPGEVLKTGATGFADIEEGRFLTPETTMPIASISKVIIGLSAAAAIHDGELDPSAPLSEYLSVPFDPPDGIERTFDHLATHSAGIVDTDDGYEEVGYFYGDTRNPASNTSFLSRYFGAEGDLYSQNNFASFRPGEAYEYSNVGAGLAGQALSDATQIPFETYSIDVLAPLGLSGFWGQTRPQPEDGALLYKRGEDNNFEEIEPYGLATWPDGQFNASAADLARLLAMVMGDGTLEGEKLYEPEVIALLTQSRLSGVPGFAADDDYVGLFWGRETLALGPLKLVYEGHSGGDPGVVTFMYRKPGNPTGFVLMFNGEPRNLIDVLAMVRLARHLDGLPLPSD